MANKLSPEQFKETFGSAMKDVSDVTYAKTNLRPAVEEALEAEQLGVTREELEIHRVYLSADEQYRHILCAYGKPNLYLVLVLDHAESSFYGYHLLDLNEEYGSGAV